MLNIKTTTNGHKLTIEVDLSANHGRSRTGKTVIIASTQGNKKIEGPEGEDIFLGLNCYKK